MKLLLLCISLFITATCAAQSKYDANWCFGKGAGIYFSDTGATTFACNTSNDELNATISNKNGLLQLYLQYIVGTEFYNIINSNNKTITGGDSIIAGKSVTNGSVFLPIKGDSLIYLFHIGRNPDSIGPVWSLFYTKIVKSQQSWHTIEKNKVLIANNISEKLSVVRHANGIDWWVYTHKAGCNNTYYRFKVNGDGSLGVIFSQDVGTDFCNGGMLGETAIASNGNFMASTLWSLGKVDVFKIDRCTGLLTLLTTVNHSGSSGTYSCAFSENNKALYFSSTYDGFLPSSLYQYYLDSIDHNGGLTLIGSFSEYALQFGQMELGHDGKIYISHLGYINNQLDTFYTKCLSIINSPNEVGMACNFQQFSFCFTDTAKISWGLPNMPNYNLGPSGVFAARAGNSDTLCGSGGSVTLGVPQQPNILYQWQTNPTLSSTTIAQPTATPTQDTWYYLTVTDTTATSCAVNTDSVFVKVEDCVGVEEPHHEMHSYRVYPNPVSPNHTATITLGTEEFGWVRVYNIQGSMVGEYWVTTGTNELNLTKTLKSTGVYIYKVIVNNDLKRTDKLIVVE